MMMNVEWDFTNACTNPAVLKILSFIFQLLDILCFIIPMVLIIMLSVDFLKNVIASKDEEFQKNANMVIKRIVFAIVLFLLPTIVKFMLALVSDATNNLSGEYQSCIDNIDYIKVYENNYNEMLKQEEEKWKRYLAKKNSADNIFRNVIQSYTISDRPSNEGSNFNGTTMGQKYNLTDEQLRFLTSVCIREQGDNLSGIQAEASLMANLYEIKGGGYSSVDSYVRNSGWFGSNFSGLSNPTTEQLDAVKTVLIFGNRTLPLYVDEHDCIYCGPSYGYDIISATNNGVAIDVNNRSLYQQDVTVLKNKYGATYTFYTFPYDGADPFGYTAEARAKVQARNS